MSVCLKSPHTCMHITASYNLFNGIWSIWNTYSVTECYISWILWYEVSNEPLRLHLTEPRGLKECVLMWHGWLELHSHVFFTIYSTCFFTTRPFLAWLRPTGAYVMCHWCKVILFKGTLDPRLTCSLTYSSTVLLWPACHYRKWCTLQHGYLRVIYTVDIIAVEGSDDHQVLDICAEVTLFTVAVESWKGRQVSIWLWQFHCWFDWLELYLVSALPFIVAIYAVYLLFNPVSSNQVWFTRVCQVQCGMLYRQNPCFCFVLVYLKTNIIFIRRLVTATTLHTGKMLHFLSQLILHYKPHMGKAKFHMKNLKNTGKPQ